MLVIRYHSKAKDRLDSVIKMLDEHMAILDAKLLAIIHAHDPHKDWIYNYEKKLDEVREEIQFANQEKRKLVKLYSLIEEGEEDDEGINDMINDIMHWDRF